MIGILYEYKQGRRKASSVRSPESGPAFWEVSRSTKITKLKNPDFDNFLQNDDTTIF